MLVVLSVLVGCNGGSDIEPTLTPVATPTETILSTPKETIPSTPTSEPILSVFEAQTLLRERFGEHSVISHITDTDRQEEGIQQYGFSVDYSGIGREIPAGACVYVWVNSITGWMDFEEPNFYANIPDSMFPIPMSNVSWSSKIVTPQPKT